MNRKLLCDALSMINDTYIAETIASRNNRYSRKGSKIMIAVAVAVLLVLTTTITVFAADLWGIRSLLLRSGTNMPEEADKYIIQQSSSFTSDDWSCEVRESLCDGKTVIVSAAVRCSDKFILVPDDLSASDPAASMGIESDKTLAEYAASRGRELLYVSASIQLPDTHDQRAQGYLHYEYAADDEIIILLQVDEAPNKDVTNGICIVYVHTGNGVNARYQLEQLEFTIVAAQAISTSIFVPVDADAVPGLRMGSAVVTETVMGVSVECPETVMDNDAFGRMEMVCVEMPGLLGGSIKKDDGWYLQLRGGRVAVPDSFTVRVLDVQTGRTIGEIVFERKKEHEG